MAVARGGSADAVAAVQERSRRTDDTAVVRSDDHGDAERPTDLHGQPLVAVGVDDVGRNLLHQSEEAFVVVMPHFVEVGPAVVLPHRLAARQE